jgi:hypothetical protein
MKPYLISITVFMLAALVSACGSAQTIPPTNIPEEAFRLATSIQDVVGIWHVGSWHLRFYEDGILHIANTGSLEVLDKEPFTVSEISFEGTQMSINEIAESNYPSCKGLVGIYEVRLLSNGKMQLVRIHDECSPRNHSLELTFDFIP